MNLKYSEIIKKNEELAKKLGGEPYRIKVLQNIITSSMNPILEFHLRSNGVNAQVASGDYDNIVQNSEELGYINAVVIFWEVSNIIEGGQYRIDNLPEIKYYNLKKKIKSAYIMDNIMGSDHCPVGIDIDI